MNPQNGRKISLKQNRRASSRPILIKDIMTLLIIERRIYNRNMRRAKARLRALDKKRVTFYSLNDDEWKEHTRLIYEVYQDVYHHDRDKFIDACYKHGYLGVAR